MHIVLCKISSINQFINSSWVVPISRQYVDIWRICFYFLDFDLTAFIVVEFNSTEPNIVIVPPSLINMNFKSSSKRKFWNFKILFKLLFFFFKLNLFRNWIKYFINLIPTFWILSQNFICSSKSWIWIFVRVCWKRRFCNCFWSAWFWRGDLRLDIMVYFYRSFLFPISSCISFLTL